MNELTHEYLEHWHYRGLLLFLLPPYQVRDRRKTSECVDKSGIHTRPLEVDEYANNGNFYCRNATSGSIAISLLLNILFVLFH